MAVIIDGNRPNFSADSLKLMKVFYGIKIEEVLAIAIESFRHDHAETFFKNSMRVTLCESHSDEEYVKDVIETIDDLWKEVHPWLLDAYRIYPPLKMLIVHHIDYKEDRVRIYAYADLP